MRVLLEFHRRLQVVDRDARFGRYELLILPDAVEVDGELRRKLDEYVAAGGALLVTGPIGPRERSSEWPTIGVRWRGASPFSPEYLSHKQLVVRLIDELLSAPLVRAEAP